MHINILILFLIEKMQKNYPYYGIKKFFEECFDDGEVIVEIGCGSNEDMAVFVNENVKKMTKYYAIDKRSTGLELFSNRYKDKSHETDKLILETICRDASKLHFNDNYVDLVIFNDALLQIDNIEEVIKETWRILKNEKYILAFDYPFYIEKWRQLLKTKFEIMEDLNYYSESVY